MLISSVHLTIDGVGIDALPGQTVLAAAREHGIYVPALCWHARTGKAGRCRACAVQVEGMRGLQEACALEVRAGMVVSTDTARVRSARQLVCELLLANGKHNCLSCEANGNCELQTLAYHLGIERPSFVVATPDIPKDESSEGIVRDPDKCIQCGRCVSACNTTVVNEVLDFGWRGHAAQVVCDDNQPMGASACVQCGECLQVCPVGALVVKQARGKLRSWETQVNRVICPYCGVGCSIDMHSKDGRIAWAMGTEENWVNLPNQGMLCVKGRFGLDYLHRADRLTQPLIRRNGQLEAVGWEEALDFVATRLDAIRQRHGPGAIGCFSSAKTSNEENFAMMRFARAVLGTNNVDHCARLCHASTVVGLESTLGSGAMTNSMQESAKSKLILVTGSNTTWCHPVYGSLIKQAVRQHGVKLMVADPRATDLARLAHLHLRQHGGSDVAWLMGLQHIIVREGWHDQAYIRARCENWQQYEASLAFFTPETVEALSGIPQQQLFEAAKLIATHKPMSIVFSMGITQHSHGVDNVKAIANLSLLTGNLGIEGGGVNPLRGQNNVQGACDMGALPNVFSGYQPVSDAASRDKFAQHWKIPAAQLDAEVGRTAMTMIEACGEDIKALYVMGENPMVSDPNLNHVEVQLRKLELLVVQDIFLTETAQLADVVLPGVAFAEKTGTYTNTERRVQLSRAALAPPPGARQDYAIIADLATRLGCSEFPRTPEALFAEIRQLTPSYHGMSYDRLAKQGLRWPCPDQSHPGTPILHVGTFARGRALLSPLQYRPSVEPPDSNYPLRLSTGRLLQHFHTGSMTRRSLVLDKLVPHGCVEINPDDARPLAIVSGDRVRVKTRRGHVETVAEVTERVGAGTIFMAFHFAEAAANRLTSNALDPVAKIPEFKVCAARIRKLE